MGRLPLTLLQQQTGTGYQRIAVGMIEVQMGIDQDVDASRADISSPGSKWMSITPGQHPDSRRCSAGSPG
jgi:hypothetical protein